MYFPFRSLSKLGSAAAFNTNPDMCDHLVGLVGKQKRICKRHTEVMRSVTLGANVAIEECQFQFQNRRWNCSTVDAKKVFGNVLKLGKELIK